MKLVVGLGNPGVRYLMNRHNAGFMAIDRFTRGHGLTWWEKRFRSEFLSATIEGCAVGFLKPSLYMNLSGGPVREALGELDITTSNIVVIHDDIDLPLGEVRLKLGGGSAGHNGVRSIIEELGDPGFFRIRIGVGRPPAGMSAADYVLDNFGEKEEADVLVALDAAADILQDRFFSNSSNSVNNG